MRSRDHADRIREVLDEYAYFLGILCLDIFKFYNPEQLVLSGTVPENSQYLMEKVTEFVKKNTQQIPLFTGKLVVGKLKEEAGLRGAIALALQVVFESP